MAISMGAALLGSAVIGGIGSAIGGSKNSKAINRATDAQTQANSEANRINLEARNQNVAMQQPFYQTGVAANNRVNALLGLSSQQSQQQQPSYSSGGMGASGTPQGFANTAYARGMRGGDVEDLGDMRGGAYIDQPYGGFVAGQPTGQPPATAQPNELQAAQNAFGDWRENTGYQFRFNEGIRAIDAGAPVRNSGATLKARMQYGQGIGSAEFGNYFGALQDQQRVGVGAANALSGVQTTYANNAANNAQMQGQNLANSAIARANNTNSMISGITSSFGNALGAFAR